MLLLHSFFGMSFLSLVLGGVHVSALPSEALEHADAVIIGEAEGIWEKLLVDFAAGAMQPTYRSEKFCSMEQMKISRRDLLDREMYTSFNTLQATMYVCILDEKGEIREHRNMKTDRDAFLKAVASYREDIVVAVECIFTWYWVADLCHKEGIPFVLGHVLYMKAIHGGKAKNDKIDSQKIAVLLRGGMMPMAYVYPAKMRATRDLMRRRNHLMRKRSELYAHIQNTNSQYNLPDTFGPIARHQNRDGIAGQFEQPSVQKSIAVDIEMIRT